MIAESATNNLPAHALRVAERSISFISEVNEKCDLDMCPTT
jgi:hypothetical protein